MMGNKLKYVILEEEAVILEYYCGKFHSEELVDFKRRIGLDVRYNASYNVISDIREAELLFSIEEAEKYVTFLLNNQNHIGLRKTAMITKTPNQVVASLGYDLQKKTFPMLYKIFSSFEAAYTFLGLSSIEKSNVDSFIQKLNNECDCSFDINAAPFNS